MENTKQCIMDRCGFEINIGRRSLPLSALFVTASKIAETFVTLYGTQISQNTRMFNLCAPCGLCGLCPKVTGEHFHAPWMRL
jgi:hypothetical protein